MRVFLTGASGWIGSVIVRDLVEAGHSVVGLVRLKEKGDALSAIGATPLIGTLGDLDVLRQGATDADGIIHTAFGLDMSKIEQLADEDRTAIETFGDVFAGSARPIIVTSGFLHLTDEKATEDGQAGHNARISARIRTDGICSCRARSPRECRA